MGQHGEDEDEDENKDENENEDEDEDMCKMQAVTRAEISRTEIITKGWKMKRRSRGGFGGVVVPFAFLMVCFVLISHAGGSVSEGSLGVGGEEGGGGGGGGDRAAAAMAKGDSNSAASLMSSHVKESARADGKGGEWIKTAATRATAAQGDARGLAEGYAASRALSDGDWGDIVAELGGVLGGWGVDGAIDAAEGLLELAVTHGPPNAAAWHALGVVRERGGAAHEVLLRPSRNSNPKP